MTSTATGPRIRVDYTPTPRQAAAHSCPADELLYGGAAGGGKSRFARAEALAFALEVPGSASIIFRRTFPDLSRAGGVIQMTREEYPSALAPYNSVDHRWTLINGSTIELAHLSRDADVVKYQGAEYQLVVFEEGTHFTEYQYRYLLSRLRASGHLKARLEQLGRRPRAIVTANPGGVGHAWVKARWIDPAPAGELWRPEGLRGGRPRPTRCFIPAKVTDNPHIDDDYVGKLHEQDADTARALLEGDWDVYQGQRFGAFRREVHVIDPEDLPLGLGGVVRAVGVDYGLDAPYAALWGARLADGLIVVYREDYRPGLTPAEQADAIVSLEAPGERDTGRPIPVALDPSTWARNPNTPHTPTGKHAAGRAVDDAPPPGSIADTYRKRLGSAVVKAQNDRLTGVALVSDKLRVRADGLPRLLIYSTCRNLIRTLPALPRDQKRPEDVDTKAEDHAYDALRYLVMELERHSTGDPTDRRDDVETRAALARAEYAANVGPLDASVAPSIRF
ncbi:MAG: terminase family protein [Burkholderiaceae bacterium]